MMATSAQVSPAADARGLAARAARAAQLKVIFSNTSYSAKNSEAQIAVIRGRRPDIVVVSEVGRARIDAYAESLLAAERALADGGQADPP